MNLISERERLEKNIENKINAYNENKERIALAKEKIDNEAILRKEAVDKRYKFIQNTYEFQINQMKSLINSIDNEINYLCQFSLEDIGTALEKVMEYKTNKKYSFRIIHGILREHTTDIEVNEKHYYIGAVRPIYMDNIYVVEEGNKESLSLLSDENIIVLNYEKYPLDIKREYGIYDLKLNNNIYSIIINEFFDYVIEEIVSNDNKLDIVSLADLYINKEKENNISRNRIK